MRLTPTQARIIGETVRSMLGPGARVRLFGSRTDDTARGGDIDLFVEVDRLLENRAAAASRLAAQPAFMAWCHPARSSVCFIVPLTLGDQRIDIVLVDRDSAPEPIHAVARQQGIPL